MNPSPHSISSQEIHLGATSQDDLLKAQNLALSLLESSHDGIIVLDRSGTVEQMNQCAQSILKVEHCEFIGRPISEIFTAYDLETEERIDLADDRYRKPQLAKTSAYTITEQGRRNHISFELKPNTNLVKPELSGALLFIQDLREADSAEAEIRLIATALKSIGEGVVITDINWEDGNANILYANDGFTEITGYSDIEVIGRSISMLNGPNTDLTVINEMVDDITQGRPTAGESVGYKKDGSEFILAWKIFPVFGMPDQITNYVVIQRDVSQIRRLEQDLFQSQKMEAVGRLAGGIAHDFNNILAVILSFSDLILEQSDEDNPHRTFLTEIRKAAERAADLTQQLLSFSRRNKNLKPEVLDVVKVTRDMQNILRRLIPEDISFKIDYIESPTLVNINRTAIEQILINFTTNARDAMPDGGEAYLSVSECTAEQARSMLPEYMEARPHMVLSFRDNGTGIDLETQRHIFEPFFTTKETGKGTGLGLATVYGIVKQANGHIQVSSETNKGTQFSIFLPTIKGEAAVVEEADEPPAESLASQSRHKVLVVEDDETMCDCISGLLVQYNYEVYSANRAEDALDFFEKSNAPFDLLITDMILPKMRGSELAKRLLAKNPDMQVIYMTGYPEEILAKFNVPEDSVVLKKPFSLKSALMSVQNILNPAKG